MIASKVLGPSCTGHGDGVTVKARFQSALQPTLFTSMRTGIKAYVQSTPRVRIRPPSGFILSANPAGTISLSRTEWTAIALTTFADHHFSSNNKSASLLQTRLPGCPSRHHHDLPEASRPRITRYPSQKKCESIHTLSQSIPPIFSFPSNIQSSIKGIIKARSASVRLSI